MTDMSQFINELIPAKYLNQYLNSLTSIIHLLIFMHPSAKKKMPSSALYQSPAPKPKKLCRSINKSERSFVSYNSKSKRSDASTTLHKMMTEEPYTRIFNKLMNMQDLK
jgi:hypothetical protein